MRSLKFIFLLFISVALTSFSCVKKTINTNSLALASPETSVIMPTLDDDNEKKFKVIGYVPEWSINLNSIQFDKLTHINYAFVIPTSTGHLKPLNNVGELQSLVFKAHSKNVKVLVSIGGWNYGDDSAFISLTNNSTYTANFINEIIKLLTTYNFDGVDIDWETPKAGSSSRNFTHLMKQLSIALQDKNKLLSAAVPPLNVLGIENEVFKYVDYLNIMAYDSFFDLSNQSSYHLAVSSIEYWKGRGLSKSKIILGVPFYGRARKNYDWTSYELYNSILANGGNPNEDAFNGITYNGIQTIKKKTVLANKEGSGIMIWELSGDANGTNSLLKAIKDAY